MSKTILSWIKKELEPVISKAVADSGSEWDAPLLAAMAFRETGIIMARNMDTHTMPAISAISRGDYSKRPNDEAPMYHGYGFWQIDIDSFPDFVKSGDWKDVYKCCLKAISVLNGKKKYIKAKKPSLSPDALRQASIAAYNCGEGNVVKMLTAGKDVDTRTAHGDYSKSVLKYRSQYMELE